MRPVSRRMVRTRTVRSVALQLELADDNVCGPDDLAEADDGGVTQAGDRRHPQALECAESILAPDRRRPESPKIVGQEHS